MRRLAGLLILLVALLPLYNLGLAAYSIPFNSDVTAYAYNRGDSCADSIGLPPLLGIDGGCSGWVAKQKVAASADRDAIEAAYRDAGSPAFIKGPSYGAGEDSRAGKQIAAGRHPTDAVITIGLTGQQVVERLTGWALVLGLAAPVLFVAGAVLLLWPRRRSISEE